MAFVGTRRALLHQRPSWVIPGATLDIDFINDRSFVNGQVGASRTPLSITRASVAMQPNASGVYYSFASGLQRVTNLGTLVEESRTNSIRNNSNTGASAPSTLPTNWSISLPSGLTATYAFGTENGLSYADVTVSGTTGDTNGIGIGFDTATGIAALNAQVWAISASIRLTAGSLANVDLFRFRARQTDSGGATLADINGADLKSSIGATLTRFSAAFTLNNASTAFMQPRLSLPAGSGVAISFTLRIAAVQAELGSFATSPILTTSAAVTRAGDAITLPTLATNIVIGTQGFVYTQFNSPQLPTTGARFFDNNGQVRGFIDPAGSFVMTRDGASHSANTANNYTPGQSAKGAASWGAAGLMVVLNGGTVAAGTDTLGATAATTYLGNTSALNRAVNGYISRFALGPVQPPSAALKAMTQ